MKNTKIKLKNREIRIFAILFRVADVQLIASSKTDDKFEERCFLITAIVMIIFAFEAFLNHVGDLKLNNWKEIERKLSIKEKLYLLSELCGFELDFGKDPLQIIIQLKKHRDYYAHGKTQYFPKVEEYSIKDLAEWPPIPFNTEWDKDLTHDKTLKGFNATKEMIVYIGNKSGLDIDNLRTFGSSKMVDKDTINKNIE